MPFASNIQQVPPSNLDVKEERRAVVEQISNLSEEIESKKIELELLSALLIQTKSEFAAMQPEHESLLTKLVEARKQKDITLSDLDGLKNRLADLKIQEMAAEKKKTELSATYKQLENLALELEAKIADLTKTKAGLSADIWLKETEFTNKKAGQKIITDELEMNISNLQKTLADMSRSIASSQIEINLLREQKNVLESTVAQLEKETKDTKKTINEILSAAQLTASEIQKTSEEAAEKKTLELQVREGDISSREKYLKEKWLELTSAKAQLEQLTNRKIPIHI